MDIIAILTQTERATKNIGINKKVKFWRLKLHKYQQQLFAEQQ